MQGFETYQSQIWSSPFQLSNSIRFVRLPGKLDECDSINLNAKINELTRIIKAKFRKLRNWVINTIKADKVDRDILISTMSDSVEFTEEERRTLTNSGVIMKMVSYSSYLNYNLLEDIVDDLELDRGPLEEYLSDFSKFCEVTPCVEVIGSSVEGSTPGSVQVHFKLDKAEYERLSTKDIDLIRGRIAKTLAVKKSALYIDSVETGCVLLTFLVPQFIVERVFPLSDEQIKAMYAELNVVSISIHYPGDVKVNTSKQASYVLLLKIFMVEN